MVSIGVAVVPLPLYPNLLLLVLPPHFAQQVDPDGFCEPTFQLGTTLIHTK